MGRWSRTREVLIFLAREAGLDDSTVTAIEVDSIFSDFEGYWRPFTLGAVPASGYCVSLPEEARDRLRNRLFHALPRQRDRSIVLRTQAWAVISRVG